MRRFYLIGFLMLVTLDTLAQVSFKMAALSASPLTANLAWLARVAAEPWIYAAIACYAGTFFVWMTLLVRAPLGPAYAASHLEVVVVLLLSCAIFNEQVTIAQIAGCILIVSGIVCLAMGEAQSDQPAGSERRAAA
ncbi:MAG: EamA family transporter [Pseudomonadota bacterium]